MQHKRYYFYIQCIILYYPYNLTMGLLGPSVRSAHRNEFPFVVSIMKRTDSTNIQSLHKCTGNLVSKQDILTAEHCLRTTFTEGFKVKAESRDLTQGTFYYPIFVWSYEHWVIYKRRAIEGDDHDIAFIKINKNIPDNIHFAPLGNIEHHLLAGYNLMVAGFGKIYNDSVPRILQAGSVKILTNRQCERKIANSTRHAEQIDENKICTVGEPYVLLNRGDSGGPLIYQGILVAINIAVYPNIDGTIQPYQVNFHINIRNYQEYIGDMKTIFFARL